MPFSGDLGTMPLCDLLQWIADSQKTGLLELERDSQVRRIEFRKGLIGSCCADDPDMRIGQYLLTRGRLTSEQLAEAMSRQEEGGPRLGWVLVQMGLLDESEVTQFVADHIEETVRLLFEWDDARFSFYEGATCNPNQIEVGLPVRDVMMRGVQVQDELKHLRDAFPTSGAVLRRTAAPVPEEILARPISRRIFESIDGRRSVGEILREARASEMLVAKLLFRLQELGLVEIAELGPADPDRPTILDVTPTAAPRTAPLAGERADDGEADATLDALQQADDCEVELEAARRLMARGEWLGALELLNSTYSLDPDSEEVGHLLGEAEFGYVQSAGRSGMAASAVPTVVEGAPDGEALEPVQAYLLGLIDGEMDVQALLSRATLREADVVTALEQMLDRGVIELGDPEPAASPSGTNVRVARRSGSGLTA